MSARAGVRLHDALQSYGEHLAFVSGERRLSYSEVREQSLSVARALRDLGIQSGDVVMISLPDSIDAMLTYLACWWVNATPMVIDFRMPMAERAELAGIAGVKLTIEKRTTKLSHSYAGIEWEDAWLFGQGVDVNESRASDVPAAYSPSSGTTGKPKIYVQSHEVLGHRLMTRRFDVVAGQSRLLTPMMLSFSATRNAVLEFLCTGGAVILDPPLFSASELIERLLSTGVEATVLAPSVIRSFLREVGSRDAPLFSDLKLLRSVGGPALPEDNVAAYRNLTKGYLMSYSSGLTGPIAKLAGNDVLARPETVGRPADHAKFTIVDPETLLELPAGAPGLIRVASPLVADRVITAEGQEAERFGQGWGIPGDIGVLDEAGFLTIIGREADMIVRGGVNVAPQELERILRAADGVIEVAVLGVADDALGQEIAAFFVSDLDEAELHAICMRHCTPDRRPRILRKVPALPLNANGKLQRTRLAQMLEV